MTADPLGELPVYGIVLNVVSHVSFIWALTRSLQLRDYIRAYLAAHILFFSSVWHLCAPSNGFCLFSRATSQTGDYVSSLLLPYSLLLLLVPFGAIRPSPEAAARGATARQNLRYLELWLHFVGVTVILIAGAENGGFWPLPWAAYLPLIGLAVVVVVASWITVWRRYGHAPHYDGLDLGIGVAAGIVGLVLFLGVEDALLPYYWSFTVHAPWHLLAGLGFTYLQESRSRTHHGLEQFSAFPHAAPAPLPASADDPYNIPGESLFGAPVGGPPPRAADLHWPEDSSSSNSA